MLLVRTKSYRFWAGGQVGFGPEDRLGLGPEDRLGLGPEDRLLIVRTEVIPCHERLSLIICMVFFII